MAGPEEVVRVQVVVVSWADGALLRSATEQVLTTAAHHGHGVELLDLVRDGFRPAMSPEERTAYEQVPAPVLDDAVASHVRAVQSADGLVFVYPTLAGTLPPAIKGWLERVMLPGVAFGFDERSGRVRPALGNVARIAGIATYRESRLAAALQGDGGRRILRRALRLNTGWTTRTAWIGCYGSAAASPAGRRRFLDRVADEVAGW